MAAAAVLRGGGGLLRKATVAAPNCIGRDGENLGNNHGHCVLRVTNLFAKLSLLLKIDPIDCQSTLGVSNNTIENYANVFHHCCSDFRENVEDVDVWMNDLRKVSSDNLVFLWGFGNLDSSGALKERLYGTHDTLSEDFELSMLDKSCAVVVFWKANLAQTLLQDVGSGNIHSGALSDMISDGLRVAGYEAYKRVCGMGLWEMDLADAFDKFLFESTDDPSVNETKLLLFNARGDLMSFMGEVHWWSGFALSLWEWATPLPEGKRVIQAVYTF
ncbi:hypothetical protein Taro_001448 [Colocasia esculenta]|uniref:Uncharacterized protein n=1 Tax=Colocasia esculenta TaxID=4460 RepID=A0A843TFY6_COLES|nr:hypothetical protein [Colocasia esculenta]